LRLEFQAATADYTPHVGLYTELAGCYSKYKEEKLMDFLKAQYTRINIPKVIHYVQMNAQWTELVFLYVHYDEFDNAILTMMSHSADAWDHPQFKDVIPKVNSTEICYKAVQFYLSEHPSLINDLMTAMVARVDHSRVVAIVRKMNMLPLVKEYLIAIQEKNITAVNESLNELYVEEEDYESLRNSINSYDNFDNMKLATELERHELLELRRVSAFLYKKNQKWAQSVELSKKDKLFKDAIETAAESKKSDVAEGLLEYFVKEGLKECFSAALYTCYDSLRPDMVLEYAWRYNVIDFAFPYLIQVLREYTSKVDILHKESEKKKQAEEKKSEQSAFSGPVSEETMYVNQMPAIAYYPDPSQVGFTGFGGVNPGMNVPGMGGVNMGLGFQQPGFGGFT